MLVMLNTHTRREPIMKQRRLSVGFGVLWTAALLVIGNMLPGAEATQVSREARGDRTVSSSFYAPYSLRGAVQENNASGYWTEEKMRSAIPADGLNQEDYRPSNYSLPSQSRRIHAGKNASEPVYPVPEPGYQTRNAVVPETTGKVFFTYKGKDYVCSGAAINGPTKNVVATAAHCVHGGKGEGWHENIAFAPGYYNGVSRHGLWSWKTAHTFQKWINSSDSSRDQAFFTVYPRKGTELVNAVGGNGLSYNYGHRQSDVRVWGWPAGHPYNGKIPYYCDGNSRRWGLLSSDMVIPCDMTGGASGGPWLRARSDWNLGYVYGVTSRRTTSGEKLLISTPFDSSVKSLFEEIR